MTDFSERRLQTWSRSLDPRRYELRGSGDTWAEAREASPGSPYWVVCRYDWSDPDEVRWTMTETSYHGGGQGFVRATPLAGGGSRVSAEWDYTGAPLVHRPFLFLLQHGPMRAMITRMWVSALDGFAEADGR